MWTEGLNSYIECFNVDLYSLTTIKYQWRLVELVIDCFMCEIMNSTFIIDVKISFIGEFPESKTSELSTKKQISNDVLNFRG